MRKKLKINKWLLVLLFVLCNCFAFSYGSPVKSQKTICLLGEKDYAPYVFVNDLGKPDGFCVDLTKAVMRILNLPYSIRLQGWASSLDSIKSQKADLLMAISYNEKREEYLTFGGSFVNLSQNIVFRKGTTPIQSLEDLRGKKILVERDAIGQYFLEKAGFGKYLYNVDGVSKGFKLLASGYYDAMVCDYDNASYLIYNLGYTNLQMVDLQMTNKLYCFAGTDELLMARIDWAVQQLKSSGEYSTIYNKWFNRYAPSTWKRVVMISVVALLLIALLLWIFNILLRRKVAKSKEMLDTKNTQLLLALHAGGMMVWGYDVHKNLLFNVESDEFPTEGIAPEKEIARYHPDDREFLLNTMAEVTKGNIPDHPICVRKKCNDGSKEWMYLEKEFSCVKNKEGEVVTIIGTHKDVTDRHRMQTLLEESVRRMGFAIKSANLVLWEFDVNSRQLKSYNEPLVHFEDTYLMLSDEFLRYTHPEEIAKTNSMFELMKDRKDEPFTSQIRLKYPADSNWHYCMVVGAPFVKDDKTGQVIKYVGLRRDITEMTLINQKLEEEKIKAQEADRLKSAFLANMSHEIRTPLNAIVGFSNLLEETKDEEEKAKFVQLINTNNELLLQLINDILDLSKIESGVMDLHCEEFDFAKAFQHLYDNFKERIKNPAVDFICENPYKSCMLYADSNRILQIQTNFITNALKYTHKGFVKMSYQCVDDGLKLMVEDTGIGMPPSKCNRVFQRFEKLDSFAQGSGLGLSICKAIVDACHGHIGFETEEGKGSLFWAWIPCKISHLVPK